LNRFCRGRNGNCAERLRQKSWLKEAAPNCTGSRRKVRSSKSILASERLDTTIRFKADFSFNGADPKRGRGNQVSKFRLGRKARAGTNRVFALCPCPGIGLLYRCGIMPIFAANTLMTNVTKKLKCSTANKRLGRLISDSLTKAMENL
jgi:hypothetical protein